MAGPAQLSPDRAPSELCELSIDARACVLLDGEGKVAGTSEEDTERAEALGDLARELLDAVDAATRGGRPEQVEAQVERGIVYAVLRPAWTLVAVARRSALSSLVFYDMRHVLSQVEGEPA